MFRQHGWWLAEPHLGNTEAHTSQEVLRLLRHPAIESLLCARYSVTFSTPLVLVNIS